LRAAELGISVVRQGYEEKLGAAQDVFNELDLEPQQVCYVGDDLTDLPVLRRVGLGVAVADAVAELRESAHLVTSLPGGAGAVREVIEVLLKAKNRWRDLIRRYEER
jgi:YrbI family 3-deoxy-D-manno-octulosonate 8-phosphate phosphatase